MRIQGYKANELVFREGVEGFQKLVVVVEGSLVNKSNGARIVSKGECCGEQFLLEENQQWSL